VCGNQHVLSRQSEDFVRGWLQVNLEQQQQQQQQQHHNVCESSVLARVLKLLKDKAGFDTRSPESCVDTSVFDIAVDDTAAVVERVKHAHDLLNQHLNFSFGQGHSGQVEHLTITLALLSKEASTFCQTGFNSGHSAVTVLESSRSIKVLSFDIGWESVVFAAERYMNGHERYSSRHELVLGDSRDTVAAVADARARFCDMVLVDGGHFNDVPFSDIMSLALLSHNATLLIVDDTPLLRDVEAAWSVLRSCDTVYCARVLLARMFRWQSILHCDYTPFLRTSVPK
jgi:hypothetical protein